MTFRPSFLLLGILPLGATFLASGCGSGDCENTGSCGDYSDSGEGGNAGRGGSAGSSAAGTRGGDAGQGGGAATGGSVAGTGAAGAGASGEAGSSGGGASGGSAGRAGAGGDGVGGEGGMGGSAPCDGACSGDTPVCDVEMQTCVGCLSGDDCSGDKPACDTAEHECVECTAADADACADSTPVCEEGSHVCVECIENARCTEATASRCSETHECVECSGNEDCTHITGRGVCDGGTCVECTVEDETACGANSCNPETQECTETPRGSVGTCEPCLADSECVGGDQDEPERRCVRMQFQGTTRDGGFCLRRRAPSCSPPYVVVIIAESLSGAASEEYCGIDEDSTRCEAVLDMVNSSACPDKQDSSCGCRRDSLDGSCVAVGAGGLCRTVGGVADQCTIPCAIANQCADILGCSEAEPYCH